MKKRQPGTYGFTAALKDVSFERIAREAKRDTRFILTQLKNTKTNREFVGVLIRKDALPLKNEGLKLLGKPLTKNFGRNAGEFRYTLAFGRGVSAHKIVNKVKDDLQRLRNHLDQRNIRVLVEAL